MGAPRAASSVDRSAELLVRQRCCASASMAATRSCPFALASASGHRPDASIASKSNLSPRSQEARSTCKARSPPSLAIACNGVCFSAPAARFTSSLLRCGSSSSSSSALSHAQNLWHALRPNMSRPAGSTLRSRSTRATISASPGYSTSFESPGLRDGAAAPLDTPALEGGGDVTAGAGPDGVGVDD
jgi:hypothetical protein